jgi:hypothetical protein
VNIRGSGKKSTVGGTSFIHTIKRKGTGTEPQGTTSCFIVP